MTALPAVVVFATGAADAQTSREVRAGTQAAALPGPTTLSYTASEQSYVVPSDVTLVSVQTVGAGGGSAFGGEGFELTAQLPVTPNATLYVEIGQTGSTQGGASFGGGGAPGTTSAGTTNSNAGSGGGATDVRTCSEAAKSCSGGGTSVGSRLIVAGGGGGGGGQGNTVSDVCGVSQSGGNAGAGSGSGGTVVTTSAGTVILGSPGATSSPSTPPGGGSTTAGTGAPSAANCGTGATSYTGSGSGSSGTGANGGAAGSGVAGSGGGGGGGGGYFGGGGGASGPEGCIAGTCDTFYNGEGGGGGSSFVSSSATLETGSYNTTLSPPSVTFTPQIEIDSPASGATYAPGQAVTASWSCSAQVTGCTGTVASGQPVPTSQCGPSIFSVTGSIMSQSVTGTVHYAVGMEVTTTSLPGAAIGVAYRQQLEATCGVAPYKWRRTSGTLPKGLKLKSDGMIMGDPYKKDSASTYTFAVVAKDSAKPRDIATRILTLDLTSP